MKANITINDELMERADHYASENYMSRSGLVSVALTNYLNQMEAYRAIKEMALAMRKIADTGEISSEQMEALQDMERLASMCFKER